MTKRCDWCGDDPLYIDYHDTEWGVPSRDDAHLFEMLVLEGAQAGLAWITVLRKREGYRELFDGFDAGRIARYTDRKLDKLLLDPRIIRNRLKVYGTRQNARAFLAVQEEFGSFSEYIWGFVENRATQSNFIETEILRHFLQGKLFLAVRGVPSHQSHEIQQGLRQEAGAPVVVD